MRVNGARVVPTASDGVYTLSGIGAGDLVRIIFSDTASATPGDMNGDGEITLSDLTAFINFCKNGGSISENPAADVNEDGYINNQDLIGIVNILIGKDN